MQPINWSQVEWGSVADWVSGIGSMAAVFAALIIAYLEWRRATRSEVRERKAATEKQASLTTEAVRLAEQMLWLCNDLLEDARRMDDKVDKTDVNTFLVDMKKLKNKIISLQQFPNDDPRLYVELEQLKTLCDFNAKWMRHSAEIAETELDDRIDRITLHRNAIKYLQAEQSEVTVVRG